MIIIYRGRAPSLVRGGWRVRLPPRSRFDHDHELVGIERHYIAGRITAIAVITAGLPSYTNDPHRLAWYLRCVAQLLRILAAELQQPACRSCRCFRCVSMDSGRVKVTINPHGEVH